MSLVNCLGALGGERIARRASMNDNDLSLRMSFQEFPLGCNRVCHGSAVPGCRSDPWSHTVGSRSLPGHTHGSACNSGSDSVPGLGTPYTMGQPNKKGTEEEMERERGKEEGRKGRREGRKGGRERGRKRGGKKERAISCMVTRGSGSRPPKHTEKRAVSFHLQRGPSKSTTTTCLWDIQSWHSSGWTPTESQAS